MIWGWNSSLGSQLSFSITFRASAHLVVKATRLMAIRYEKSSRDGRFREGLVLNRVLWVDNFYWGKCNDRCGKNSKCELDPRKEKKNQTTYSRGKDPEELGQPDTEEPRFPGPPDLHLSGQARLQPKRREPLRRPSPSASASASASWKKQKIKNYPLVDEKKKKNAGNFSLGRVEGW